MKSSILLAAFASLLIQDVSSAQCLTGNDVGISYDAGNAPASAANPLFQGWSIANPSGFNQIGTSSQTGLPNYLRFDDQNAGQMGRLFYTNSMSTSTWEESARFGWELTFRVDPQSGKEGFVEVITGNDGGNVRYSVHFDVTSGAQIDLLNPDSILIASAGLFVETFRMVGLPTGDVELWAEPVVGTCVLLGLVPAAAPDIAIPASGAEVRFGSGWTPNNGSNVGVCDFNEVTYRTLGSPVGTVYCSPAVASPLTGLYAEIEAYGWDIASYNSLEIRVTNCPANVAAVMLVGPAQGFIPFAGGSNGHLCIGLPFGRYAGGLTDSTGGYTQVVDTNGVPCGSLPLCPVVAGDLLNLQLWYRDALVPGGPTVTSNFSEAVHLDFQ